MRRRPRSRPAAPSGISLVGLRQVALKISTLGDRISTIDIGALRSGDQADFCYVLEQFSPLVQSIVSSRVWERHEHDDLFQEICLRIWERRTQFSGRGSLAGWITRIAHRTCHNWLQKRRAIESMEERCTADAISVAESTRRLADPASLARRNEFMKRLRQGLAALPERQADAFILVRVRGYTAGEAADVFGVKTATVRSSVRHATMKLRRELEEFRNGL